MNILFVLPQIQKGGGQAIQALNLAEQLIKKGNNVFCLTFKKEGISKEVSNYVNKIRIFYLNIDLNYKSLLITPFLINNVRNFIQTQKIDIIQSFDPHLNSLFAILLGNKLGIPVICRIGAKYREFYEDKLLKGNIFTKILYYIKLPSVFLQILEFYTIKKMKWVVSNSNFILNALKQSFLLKNYRFNMKIIPNGVNLEKFLSNKIQADEISEKFRNKKIILYIGRIEDYKGIDTIIRALAHLNQKLLDYHLILIGSYHFNYQYFSKLKKFIADLKLMRYISFIGEVSHDTIPYYLNLAKILILPSYSPSRPIAEGLPNVILEAMASQCLVIASKVGGIPEIIHNGENGLLFEPRQHLQLAKVLQEVLMNPKKFEPIAENGRKDVIKKYDLKIIGEKYIELYQKIIESGV